MLTPDGTVKLLDLGVAKASGGIDSLRTMANSVFGTPAYISPEQAVDSSAVDMRADVYSLGVILFELLCGRRPYDGASPARLMRQLLDPSPIPDVRQFKEDVSPAVAEMLQRMCAKRPEDRIGSPKEVIDGFASIGYRLVAERADSDGGEPAAETSMKDILAGVQAEGAAASGSLDLNTQDSEIQEFTAKLRRRRIVRIATRIAVACVVLAALCWLAYRFLYK
jgi:serine/threonine-protein kinase